MHDSPVFSKWGGVGLTGGMLHFLRRCGSVIRRRALAQSVRACVCWSVIRPRTDTSLCTTHSAITRFGTTCQFLAARGRVTREKGVTRPDDASPRNARVVGPKCSGPSLHVRPGGRKKYAEATAEVHALGTGRLLTFFVTPSAAPHTLKRDTRQRLITHCTTSCAGTRDNNARSRNRTW